MTPEEKIKLLENYTLWVKIALDEQRNLQRAEEIWNGWESTYPHVAKSDYQEAIKMRDELRKQLENVLISEK